MKQTQSILANELKLSNGTTIKNRFFKSAMSEALASKNHNTSKSLIHLYETWAKGGSGLVMTGNVMIDRNALGEPGNVVVEDERDLEMLKKWAEAGTKDGTHLWMQLNHPGGQSPKTLSKEPVAPSAVSLSGSLKTFFNQPRPLLGSEIEDLITRFGEAARVAKKAGFTGVQIHAAHGYLISQFLSPHYNQRTDEWGGSLENRMRFLLETYKEIRGQVGDHYPIGIKLNSADFQRGGFTEEESMEVLTKMSEIGIDLIEISGGNYENPKMIVGDAKESTKKREAYFIDYASKAKELIPTPLVVTGGFRTEVGMTEAIESGAVDMIGIAKPLALVPDLPNRIFQGTYETVHTKPIKTGINMVDKAASMLELGWYEQQLARMGKLKSPNPNHNVWVSLMQNAIANGRGVFLKRRG
ncbi:NADH:flavin oxidoreductase/NADH oxidase family protein [Alkalicoccobacillus murimartini]|uniref:2,4-dienoyl-CoA reductase-like NADH-dependent reductase (Old Yellow Enzyme family) n=1 Tax=Alkalicoccobacillus murimartini TaxID=171685 RepID=A0ABT9YG95_9BACI|nr:NADH:flavin oxidoreductase/NADH oxidase family protein [Alkalicoccobacillus murimartini]MDQ0206623.1 2,4-dienoyl-CoA reductase-like NADH-dependent reductase (Old Yellow Enzyme family) [Alkalicoccobacillus murimartini]